jgi:outer membrane immunogenic protein
MKKLATAIAAIALIGTPAFAADMAVKARPPPPPPAPVYSWTGFYIGASAGYSWSRDDVEPSGTVASTAGLIGPGIAALQIAAFPPALSTSANGFIGGGQFGYNRQWDRFVLGVEADFSGLTGRGSNNSNTLVPPNPLNFATATGVDRQLESLGTVRGRIGFTPVDRWLIFATGGLAFGEAKSSTAMTQSCVFVFPVVGCNIFATGSGAEAKTLTGWALGGGVEYALTNSWSVKTEYLHYDLGNMTYATAPLITGVTTINVASRATFQGDIVRAGLNYRFW